MGMLDEIKQKATDLMGDPETKAKIEALAAEKGLSIDEAKERFVKKQQQAE